MATALAAVGVLLLLEPPGPGAAAQVQLSQAAPRLDTAGPGFEEHIEEARRPARGLVPGPVAAGTAPAASPGTAPAASPGADPVAPAPPSAPPVSVRVEAIGIDAPVVPLGLDAQHQLETPEDFSDVGWWQGGAVPGEVGPAVLVGHVDSYRGPAVFYHLRKLEPGDRVVITLESGEPLTYQVRGSQEIPKDEFPTELVYGHTPEPTLRLITCGGPFDRSSGHYENNTIVFADLVHGP